MSSQQWAQFYEYLEENPDSLVDGENIYFAEETKKSFPKLVVFEYHSQAERNVIVLDAYKSNSALVDSISKLKEIYNEALGTGNGEFGKELVRLFQSGKLQRFNSGIRSYIGIENSQRKHSEDVGNRNRVGERRKDGAGNSKENNRLRKTEYSLDISYSLDTYDEDVATLTPERKKEIFEQFDRDKTGPAKVSGKQVWGERAEWIAHNMTRVFPDIPERGERGAFFAEFRKMMIQWKGLASTATFMVQDKLIKMPCAFAQGILISIYCGTIKP